MTNPTATPELKECPFCGGEARHSFQSGDERVGYRIEGKASCSKCTASIVLFSRCTDAGWNEETWEQLRPRITALWNRRQPAQPAVAGIPVAMEGGGLVIRNPAPDAAAPNVPPGQCATAVVTVGGQHYTYPFPVHQPESAQPAVAMDGEWIGEPFRKGLSREAAMVANSFLPVDWNDQMRGHVWHAMLAYVNAMQPAVAGEGLTIPRATLQTWWNKLLANGPEAKNWDTGKLLEVADAIRELLDTSPYPSPSDPARERYKFEAWAAERVVMNVPEFLCDANSNKVAAWIGWLGALGIKP